MKFLDKLRRVREAASGWPWALKSKRIVIAGYDNVSRGMRPAGDMWPHIASVPHYGDAEFIVWLVNHADRIEALVEAVERYKVAAKMSPNSGDFFDFEAFVSSDRALIAALAALDQEDK